MRLQQYLARSGVTSRRKAEDLIRAGRVSINDQVAEIGATVGENDTVRLDGERVRLPQKIVVIALNKPKGYTTTHEDAHAEKLVYELVPEHPGLHSVGRLDKDTEGLLLLTNDGELTAFLSHPRNQVPKLYRVWSKRGRLSQEDCEKLDAGVMLGDGLAKAVEAQPVKGGAKLVLTEGRKREVRRMLGRVGHPVERLVRLAVGPIELGELGAGEWRYLSPEEVRLLRSNPALPELKKGSGGRAPGAGKREPEAGVQSRSRTHKTDAQKTPLGRDTSKSPREKQARAEFTSKWGKSSGAETVSGRGNSRDEAQGWGGSQDRRPSGSSKSGEARGPKSEHPSGARNPRGEKPAFGKELARGQRRPARPADENPRSGREDRRTSPKRESRTVESSREHLRGGERSGTDQRGADRRAHRRTRRTDKK
ncbi:MAG: RNA-binding protein [Meiothermus sp.]